MKNIVISVMYNEAAMLPLFVAHYRQFCDKILLFDDRSTDNSKQIACDLGCEVRDAMFEGKFLQQKTELLNSVWKEFKNYDFVIIADVDELIYHTELLKVLRAALKQKVSVFRAEGFEMMSDIEITNEKLLTKQVKTGIKSISYSKTIVFSPSLISDVKFVPGQHAVALNGNVRYSDVLLKLLHYKYIRDIDSIIKKHDRYKLKNKIEGIRYSQKETLMYYEMLKSKSLEKVI